MQPPIAGTPQMPTISPFVPIASRVVLCFYMFFSEICFFNALIPGGFVVPNVSGRFQPTIKLKKRKTKKTHSHLS